MDYLDCQHCSDLFISISGLLDEEKGIINSIVSFEKLLTDYKARLPLLQDQIKEKRKQIQDYIEEFRKKHHAKEEAEIERLRMAELAKLEQAQAPQ